MLFPEVIQFAPTDSALLEHLLPRLSAIGFDLTNLGQGSYSVSGIPAGIEGLDYVRLLHDLVDESRQGDTTVLDEVNSTLALTMARHAAIPEGQVLSNAEMESVVNALFACGNVNYTPDGRPILAILPHHDIEKLF